MISFHEFHAKFVSLHRMSRCALDYTKWFSARVFNLVDLLTCRTLCAAGCSPRLGRSSNSRVRLLDRFPAFSYGQEKQNLDHSCLGRAGQQRACRTVSQSSERRVRADVTKARREAGATRAAQGTQQTSASTGAVEAQQQCSTTLYRTIVRSSEPLS